MMAMFAIATLGMAVSCEKSDASDDGNGDINASIVGSWSVDKLVYNGSSLSGDLLPSMTITMNENGTGTIVTGEHPQIPAGSYAFSWALNGSTLNINVDSMHIAYTVTKLTSTDCSIQGTIVPVMNLQGDVRIDLKRVSTPDPNPNPDPDPDPNPDPDPDPNPNPGDTATFPAATQWTSTYSTVVPVEQDNMTFNVTIIINGTLHFDANGTTGTMTVEGSGSTVVPVMGTVSYPFGPETIPFSYTYNASAATGTMTATADGETETIAFTYNAEEGTIVVSLNIESMVDTDDLPLDEIPAGVIPEQLVFTRVN